MNKLEQQLVHVRDQIGFITKRDLTVIKPLMQDCYIDAVNDLQAAKCWLNKYQGNLKTFKCYEKEILRFLIWCQFEAGKTLAELQVQDVEAYFYFLKILVKNGVQLEVPYAREEILKIGVHSSDHLVPLHLI